MLSRKICGECYSAYVGYGPPRQYAKEESWGVCQAKPYEDNHAVEFNDPIPARCPYKFEQMVFAGMKNAR
jgi:hypothetical protein